MPTEDELRAFVAASRRAAGHTCTPEALAGIADIYDRIDARTEQAERGAA